MTRRISVSGFAVVCTLAICAFAVANASAGGRAFTCAPEAGSHDFATSDSHCVTNVGPNNGTRGHVLITTAGAAAEGTNDNTKSGTTAAESWTLHGTISGFETAIECTAANGTGTLTNEATFVKGTGVLHLTGCIVEEPAEIGCTVKEGKIDTEEVKATTNGLGANQLKFEPAGTKFASITIDGCQTPALNKTFPLTGSFIAVTTGATATTTGATITAQGTLIFGGAVAGLKSALTVKMSGGNAITLT